MPEDIQHGIGGPPVSHPVLGIHRQSKACVGTDSLNDLDQLDAEHGRG